MFRGYGRVRLQTADLEDKVLVEALVIRRCDATHSAVEPIMRDVRRRQLGSPRECITKPMATAAMPAARGAHDRGDY